MSTATVSRTRSTDKRFYGIVEGIVTDVNDDQGKEGRVKVQFPWFDDQMETEWCRVGQFYAGNGYGAFFLPEKGDEVGVGFIHGDMRKPIVLCGLYNGQDKPASYRSSSQDQKMFRTKGKHELMFDDSSGKQRVHVKTAGGHAFVMDDSGKTLSITTNGNHKVELNDSSGEVTITSSGGGTITMQNGTITIQGTTVNVQASNISLGQGAAENVMLGTSFLTIFNTHTHVVNPTTMTTVGPPVPPMTPANISKTTKAL